MNTRKVVAVLVLVLFSVFTVSAQSLTILHCSAGCKNSVSGKSLVAGQSILPTDKIALAGEASNVVLWHEKQGFMVLKPIKVEGSPAKTSGTVAVMLLPAIIPQTNYSEKFGSMAALTKHFENRQYLLLGKSWLLAEPTFGLNGDTVLFFKYDDFKNNISVSRKLEHAGDSLLLYPKFILDMNGKPVKAENARHFQLFWLDMKNKGYKQLTTFEFVFANEEEVANEVKLLLGKLKSAKKPPATYAKTIVEFLNLSFGTPDPQNVKQWLARRFPEVK